MKHVVDSENLKWLTQVVAMNRGAPSPQPSPPMGEREKSHRFMDRRASSSKAVRAGQQASTRIIVLVLASFLLGLAGGAFWFFRLAGNSPAPAAGEAEIKLSDRTKAVLKGLDSPVELRFYALLDPASASSGLSDFAGRVDQLLAAFQREAGGKIKVTSAKDRSDAASSAASADGLKPFNLEKGDACYLGLAVINKTQKEALPQLSPDWEQALESDVTRAILRVASSQPAPALSAEATQRATSAAEDVRRSIPNLATISLQEGTRLLEDKAFVAFGTATQETEERVKAAEARLNKAQSANDEAAQQAATKELLQIRAEHTEKLQKIALQLRAQIDALKELKRK